LETAQKSDEPSAPPAPTPFKTKPLNGGGEEQTEEAALR
jgi:hypothetical protein